MKKELRILVILIAVLLVGTVGYYFMPKKFGKNVNTNNSIPAEIKITCGVQKLIPPIFR